MRRLQILYYITHANTLELVIYFLPVISILCIAIAHYKIYKVANSLKVRKSSEKMFWAIRYIATFNFVILFVIAIKYLDRNEPPQKELIFKQAKISRNVDIFY
jgi:hypothetical protein